MKYKLINTITKEEHLCDKVTIDEFDYYVSEQIIKEDEYFLMDNEIIKNCSQLTDEWCKSKQPKIIATNNPNIELPKVVDEVEILALEYENSFTNGEGNADVDFKAGYNKSQETHPFSEEDVIEFAEFVDKSNFDSEGFTQHKTPKELLQLWKEEKPKIVYYDK